MSRLLALQWMFLLHLYPPTLTSFQPAYHCTLFHTGTPHPRPLHPAFKTSQVWAEEMAGRLLALQPEQWASEMARADLAVQHAKSRVYAGQTRLTQVRGWGRQRAAPIMLMGAIKSFGTVRVEA